MKEAYYFSHDSNARHDPKMTAMRGVYGSEGYGWYWMLIEMMRESEGYKLDMQSKYAFNAFALQLHSDSKSIEQFVHDCIHEFDLFEADQTHFWSSSLLRRMEIREQKSEARRKAAKARWDKEKRASDDLDENANEMQMHSKSNANGMQGKESKRNKRESKVNKNDLKDMYSDEFESFWNEYPRKIGKKDCYKTWQKIIKAGEQPGIIIQCAINYHAQCLQLKTESQFIKHPKTFLNEDRYKDYREGGSAVGHQQSQPFSGGQAASSKHDADSQAQAGQNGGAVANSGSNQQDRIGVEGDTDRSTGAGSKYDMFVRR